jgi:uncharacterized membrane protein
MTLPLIAADNMFGLLCVFLGLAAFGFWSERTRIGEWFSGVMIAIFAGMIFANLRIVPFASPFHDMVWSYVVPMAIPLLLFKADLRKILPESGKMVLAFVIACIGIIAGVFIGFALVDMGPSAHLVAGALGASWIGGSMNFAAVSQMNGLSADGTLTAAAAAADNVMAAFFIAFLLFLSGLSWLIRFIPSEIIQRQLEVQEHPEEEKKPVLDMGALTLQLFLAAACCFAGYETAALVGIPKYGVLFITIYALLIANLFPRQMHRLEGGFTLGMFFMYVFFGVIGAAADIGLMVQTAMPIFFFVFIMASVHIIFVLAGAKLFKIDLAEALIISNTVAVGPGTSAAMAAGKRWYSLVTPAVMFGVLGYAVANFIGIALTEIFA